MNTVLFLKNMVLISMNDMFGINDFAPLGLGGRNYNLPRALLGADDLRRTFGASIIVQVEFLERYFRVFYS